jgi:hypothetical protein
MVKEPPVGHRATQSYVVPDDHAICAVHCCISELERLAD